MIPILFCYSIPTIMFFSAFISNHKHLRQLENFLVARFDASIATYDPSIGEILLGNSNKSNESIFLFDESIFIFLEFFFWKKLASYVGCIDLLIFCSLLSKFLSLYTSKLPLE